MKTAKFCNFFFSFILLLAPFQIGAQQFPQPIGYVNDFANVIADDVAQQITAICQELEQKTGAEIAVVTMSTIGDEDYFDYANRLFEAWGIGKRGQDNGVLIFNAIQERKIKIEVGYGLEGILPDGLTGQILDEYAIPNLRNGDYGNAYLMTASAIARRIASDKSVELTGEQEMPDVSYYDNPENSKSPALFFILLFIFLMIITRGRILPWLIFGSMSGGGRGRDSDWGGFGRGGGFGGGFGGFGGGMSGGGGAGRSY